MTKREIIKAVLDGKKPPYVPWSFKFTEEPICSPSHSVESDTSLENMLTFINIAKEHKLK